MNSFTLRNLRTSSLLHQSNHGFLKPRFLLSTCLLQPSSTQICAALSSTTTVSKTPTPNSSNSSKVNGPLSTLPAPLNLPTRAPDQPFFFRYAFSLGKAYASFYKTGVLNIYKNFQASRPLQRALSEKHNSSLSAFISSGTLTRSEFQLLTRNWHDIKRVPVFALVFLVFGEFTPLIVLAISSIVPWTCRIPKQITSDRKKLEERRKVSFRNLTVHPPEEKGVEQLGREQLMHISWSLGLSSTAWDWFDALLTDGLLKKKVSRRVEYLGMDDLLIGKDGGVRGMEVEEVKMACVERGIDVLNRGETDMRRDLGAWLRSTQKVSIERLLLTRPSVWPAQAVNTKEE